MNCAEFEQRLETLLAAGTPAAAGAALEAHGGSCRRCGSLLAALRGGADGRLPADQDAFVAALLPRTAGSPCSRAESLLPAWVDGELRSDDAGLVAMHSAHCGGCSALAAALQALRVDLPALATVAPDADFAADVVTATRAVWRRPRPDQELQPRGWRQLWARPRFAWEFATAACSLLMLLYALPSSPLRPLPQQAMAVVRMDIVGLARDATVRVAAVDALAARAWNASGQRLADAASTWAESFARDHAETAAAWQTVRGDLAEVGAGIMNRNLAQLSHALQELGGSLKILFGGTAPPVTPG